MRPWEPSQYRTTSCRRASGVSNLPNVSRFWPCICMMRLCSMSKCAGVVEFGDETNTNPTRLRMSMPRTATWGSTSSRQSSISFA